MEVKLPICCDKDAFALFSRHVLSIESSESLLSACVAFSKLFLPNIYLKHIDSQIQQLADSIRSRIWADKKKSKLDNFHQVFFKEMGFYGNNVDFSNPENNYLPLVLSLKRGSPAMLGVVYRLVAERIGLRTWTIIPPGNSYCGVLDRGTSKIIDVFGGGREITLKEIQGRMEDTFDEDSVGLSVEELCMPRAHNFILTRILQNLIVFFNEEKLDQNVAALFELQMLLVPSIMRVKRDVSFVYARLGLPKEAAHFLKEYMDSLSEKEQTASGLKELLQRLQNHNSDL